jgi:hypothetical protein
MSMSLLTARAPAKFEININNVPNKYTRRLLKGIKNCVQLCIESQISLG